MQASPSLPSLPLLPLLPAAVRPWVRPIEPVLQKLLIPDAVVAHVDAARGGGSGARFAASLLASLGIGFEVDSRELRRIPVSGRAVVVCNHPYGIVEGLILMAMLERVRADTRILANWILSSVPEVRQQIIPVNPFRIGAQPENRAPLRQAIAWLRQGGLLCIFPAGEVAHTTWNNYSVTDPPWKTTAVRLALCAESSVVPIFFEGANSVGFQLAGILHPVLRTVSLPREFYRLRGTTIRLRVGNPIPHAVISDYGDAEKSTAYVRARTYFLANRSARQRVRSETAAPHVRIPARAEPTHVLAEEIDALPAESYLTGNRDFEVFLTRAAQIPHLLAEIGRCRELAFRAVGEGTGRSTDLDSFDDYYHHLILWSRKDSRLAGSYRLAFTEDVLPDRAIRGMYSSTLFRFKKQFFEQLGPAVELGRSFIVPEYQRSYHSLLLLWKGILRAVERRSGVRALFGAVSISREYQEASRLVMAAYLSRHSRHPLARFVVPRCPLRVKPFHGAAVRSLADAAESLEAVSGAIADIELDSKGVPVLLRHYIKTGGRLLALSIDRQFADVLDALLILELRNAPSGVLDRCLSE